MDEREAEVRSNERTLEAITLRLEEMQLELQARLPVHRTAADDEPSQAPTVAA